MPYEQVCSYKNNLVLAADYASTVFSIAKLYNNAYILIELNDLGGQVADALHRDYEYENILVTENGGRNGKKLSSGFGMPGTKDLGITTSKPVKGTGCSMIKMIVEQNQLIINDLDTISELSTFSKDKKGSYSAEPGKHDDLAMGLVLFGWMTSQPYYKELSSINTLNNLREKTEEQLHDDLTPFGFVDDHQSDPEAIETTRGWFMPVESYEI